MRFLYENLFSDPGTTLVASSAASALPVGASANPDRSYVWRSLQQSGVQTIDIDLGSVQEVTDVAVANVRLLGSGVLELYQRGDAGSAGSATFVTTLPTQDPDTRVAVKAFASQSHRHWQLKWTNPTAAADYAEVGYVFLGTSLTPDDGIQPPQISRADPSVASQSIDGQQSFASRTGYAMGSWSWVAVDESTVLADLRTLYRAVGRRTPLFAVMDDALGWMAWFCRLATEVQTQILYAEDLDASEFVVSISLGWEEVR